MDGHAVALPVVADVAPEALEAVRGRLAWLLGDRLLRSAVTDGVLIVHVVTSSHQAASLAVAAGIRAMGAADLFVRGATAYEPPLTRPRDGSASRRY